MKKLLTIIFLFTIGIFIASEASAQTAYGLSIIRINEDTRDIDGYSGTALDYYAGLYYDPEIRTEIYRPDNEVIYDSGVSKGYGDILPAEVYLYTNSFVEGKTYCVVGKHYIVAYFYAVATNQWFDPFRYSFFGGGNSPWGGFPFIYYYTPPRHYRLGTTQVCLAIPFPPTPTPTPATPTPTPPPPTPTPTPCDALNPACQRRVFVHLERNPLRPMLAAGGTNTSALTACISGVTPESNWIVNLRIENDSFGSNFDAGHKEDFHTGARPLGKIAKSQGRTGSDGCFRTTYAPPHVSGKFKIIATILGSQASTNAYTIGPDFYNLTPGDNYNLIGETMSHPSNHWGTLASVNGLKLIANDYKAAYYGSGTIPDQDKIAYNDMSLEWGGKFDLNKKWENTMVKHGEHREGINCDVRSSNIPEARRRALNRIFFERGSTDTNDETGTSAPHWHLRFLFGSAQGSATALVNGIEQNPSAFIEVNPAPVTAGAFIELAWWAILDRESTQEEWERWYPILLAAKAQGNTELLAKAKELELELFSSSEYSARGRDDEGLVEDVFSSHLLRTHTEEEKQYWLSYLQSLPPTVPKQKRRMRFVREFENIPAFEERVFSLVDETTAP